MFVNSCKNEAQKPHDPEEDLSASLDQMKVVLRALNFDSKAQPKSTR